MSVIPAHGHLDARDDDHVALSPNLDGAGDRALIVVIGDCDDLESAVGDRIDQIISRPKAIAGQRVEMKVNGIAGIDRLVEIGHVGMILSGKREYAMM